jgi:signal transduction histidine kinase
MATLDKAGGLTRPSRSLTTRVVALAVVVAAVSTVVSTVALVLVSRQGNLNQASALAQREVQQLADLDDQRLDPAAQSVAAYRKALATRGTVTELAMPARGFAVAAPFAAQDVQAAQQGATGTTARTVDGRRWMIAWAPASRRIALVAEPLTAPSWLTRRQVLDVALMALASLLGGGLAGLVLARGITGPLARLAEAARQLGAGQRRLEPSTDGPREVAEVSAALGQLSQALARSEDRQRRFLLAVSHELRTPLTAVAGYAEALADGDIAGDQVPAAAAVVRREAGRLQRRVEDLLALARLEADDFTLNTALVDLGEVVRAAAAAAAPRARAGGVELQLQAPPSGPMVVSDGERVRQAVDALCDNALRVLPAGAPLVLAVYEASAAQVVVQVRDGGPGLSPSDLAVAFDRGVLTERYRGERPVGSGLGLALVGELARRLGGRAVAEPAAEGGVAFSLVLPVRP